MKEREAPGIGGERLFPGEVGSGNQRRALEASRDRVAVALVETSGTGVASLARVLLDVVRDLGRLQPETSRRSLEEELRERRHRSSLTARGEVPVQRFGGRAPEFGPRRKVRERAFEVCWLFGFQRGVMVASRAKLGPGFSPGEPALLRSSHGPLLRPSKT
jgi:hypothetical protein